MNETKKKTEARKRLDSVLVNLRSANRQRSAEMDFYLHRLKEETGRNMQHLIFFMLHYAFEHCPEFDGQRDMLHREWEQNKDQLYVNPKA